jgi:hypothetical protein
MGYRSPEVESAPQFFLASYPQALSTGRAGLGITVSQQERTPPVAELQVWVRGTPQQKIFAKVKADLASDLRLYIL